MAEENARSQVRSGAEDRAAGHWRWMSGCASAQNGDPRHHNDPTVQAIINERTEKMILKKPDGALHLNPYDTLCGSVPSNFIIDAFAPATPNVVSTGPVANYIGNVHRK